jgi:hypothetical protein
MAHLLSLKYVTKHLFASYWYQIKEVMLSEPANVLEIGIGPNLVSSFLTQQHIRVVTMDKDMLLKPQLSGTVLHLPLKDTSFGSPFFPIQKLSFSRTQQIGLKIISILLNSVVAINRLLECLIGMARCVVGEPLEELLVATWTSGFLKRNYCQPITSVTGYPEAALCQRLYKGISVWMCTLESNCGDITLVNRS